MAISLPWTKKRCDWCDAQLQRGESIEIKGKRFCNEREARQFLMRMRRRSGGSCGGCH